MTVDTPVNSVPTMPSRPEWYTEKLESVDEATRTVLEKYSGIPPDGVIPHILKIRDRAFAIHQYPCIGQFRFLDLAIGKFPQYPEVLQRVKDGERLLDLGCCFGQDLRKLAQDGAPTSNLYGSDLKLEFTDLGYDLFLDKSSLKAHFITADIFASLSPLDELDGTVDMIQASSFFHLFGRDDQLRAGAKCMRLLKRETGSMIFGRQMGRPNSKATGHSLTENKAYWHDEESFHKLWQEIGTKAGVALDVEMAFDDFVGYRSNGLPMEEESRRLRYVVRIK